MADRYFLDNPASADRATLAGPEAHHLIHVMRAAPGMEVTLFDGGGDEFSAVVERVERGSVELSIRSRRTIDRELPFELTLGVALPKGDRQKWLVEKAVEIGVSRIVPLQTKRSVAQPVDQAITRLRRAVIEASKQCGRNRLMRIDPPRSWPDYLAGADAASRRFLAHPGGAPLHDSLPTDPPGEPETNQAVFLAIGPEGGFTDDEAAAAVAHGWQIVDLGPRILRIETAAIVLAAMVVNSYREKKC